MRTLGTIGQIARRGTARVATVGAPGRRGAKAVALSVGFALLLAACHKGPYPEVTAETQMFGGETGHATRVYLSSPRHASSGGRGECGWEENVNGRTANMWAATADTSSYKGLAGRNYLVYVSANAKDDGYLQNRQESNNLGAQVHVVTHTNANGQGCGDAAQYVLVMFKQGDTNSTGLRDKLLAKLDPVVPGGRNSWNCFGVLAECSANASHVAYVELFFHTNKAATDWFMGPTTASAPRVAAGRTPARAWPTPSMTTSGTRGPCRNHRPSRSTAPKALVALLRHCCATTRSPIGRLSSAKSRSPRA